MSDTPVPTSLGSALYGAAPAVGPQGPTNMTGESWRGVPIADLPASADPRHITSHEAPKAEPPKTLGEGIYPTKSDSSAPEPSAPAPTTAPAVAGDAFDPADVTLPEGLQADPALMSDFATATRELGVDRAGADRLLALHAKALSGQSEQWRAQSEAAFTPQELNAIRDDFNHTVGNDDAAREFRQLLAQSGLGNHPSVLKVMQRLLRG